MINERQEAVKSNFKNVLYNALVYALGATLSRYDEDSARLLILELGRKIREYLGLHGFKIDPTKSLEESFQYVSEYFHKNGFFGESEVLDSNPENLHGIYKKVFGFEAWRMMAKSEPNPFISCPFNAILCDMLEPFGLTMRLKSYRFLDDFEGIETKLALEPAKSLERLREDDRLNLNTDSLLVQLRRTNQELEALKEQLEIQLKELSAANRTKDEFLAVLSHELRAPLAPITLWAGILRMHVGDNPLVAKGLAAIEKGAMLQAHLVNDLLDLSRIASGKFELKKDSVHLKSVIDAALETIRSTASERNIRIEIDCDPDLSLLQGDAIRLQQVFWNLLSNAIKFSEVNGKVKVSVQQDPINIIIQVKDEGVGIATEVLPHIFDRFRQGDSSRSRRFGGLGLGLAIAKALVELHGGQISAESGGVGQGSLFTVRLPILDDSNYEGLLQEKALASCNVKTVFLIEDNDDNREAVSQSLQFFGYQVKTASNAQEALDSLRKVKPDLIISDIGLPDMDGFEAMKKIRKLPGMDDIPAVALTGFAKKEDQMMAIEAGFQHHVSKPIEIEKLIQTISTALTCH